MPISIPFDLQPNRIKRGCAKIFDVIGVNSIGFALQKAMFAPFVRAVNYHIIESADVGQFEDHLRYYKENFCSVDLPKLEAFLATGTWADPRPGLILSFDDGHRSHFEVAAPMLEKYGFTGWFFVPIGLMNVAEGTEQADVLNIDQLRYLDANHVVGSHTATHLRLRETEPISVLESEIVGSQKSLESILGHPVSTFCWVGGEEDTYSRQAAELIKANYQYSFMTNSSVITPSENPLQLQRTNIEAENPMSLLRFQMSGLIDLLYLNKRRRVNRLTA